MDGNVQQGIDAQLQVPVQAAGFKPCRLCGIGLLHQELGVLVGEIFPVKGPAFCIAAIVEEVTDGRDLFLVHVKLAVYSLVKVPRVTFMGKGGIQGQGIGGVFAVNINDIIAHIVYGRGQVIGRAGIILQGRGNIFYCAGGDEAFPGSRESRKIPGHAFLQVFQHFFRPSEGKIPGGAGIHKDKPGIFPKKFCQRGVACLEVLPQHGLYFPHTAAGACGGRKQIFIIGASLGKMAKPHGVNAFSGENGKGVSQLFISGQHDCGQQPVVFGNPLVFLGLGGQPLLFQGIQPFTESGVEKVGTTGELFFVHNGAALFYNLGCGGIGHKKPCLGFFLFVLDQPLKVAARLFQAVQTGAPVGVGRLTFSAGHGFIIRFIVKVHDSLAQLLRSRQIHFLRFQDAYFQNLTASTQIADDLLCDSPVIGVIPLYGGSRRAILDGVVPRRHPV